MSETERRSGRPTQEELDGLISAVIDEVRRGLGTDRWVLWQNERTLVSAYAAAALSHCCALAEELVEAHRREREMTGRLLARAIFESWVVGYYIQLGGKDALGAVAADYAFGRLAAGRAMEEHDRALRARLKKIRRRNAKIRKANEGIEIWNERNPGATPKPLHEPVPEPKPIFAELTVDDFMRGLPAVEARDMPLLEMVKRLSPITRERGFEETYELSYHYAYRSLSTFGAHANLWVLDSYLDNRQGRGLFVRVRDTPTVPSSFDEPNREMALLLLAALAVAVFESRGEEPALAADVLKRFHEVRSPDDDDERGVR